MKKLFIALLLVCSVCSFGFSEKITQAMIEKFIKNGTYILVNEFTTTETLFVYNDNRLSYVSAIHPAFRYIKKDAITELFLTTESFCVSYAESYKINKTYSLAEDSFSLDANGNIIINVKAPKIETEEDAINEYYEQFR